MQTSNRENPVENNIAEMIHTIDKISIRLPSCLESESQNLTDEQHSLLTTALNKLIVVVRVQHRENACENACDGGCD